MIIEERLLTEMIAGHEERRSGPIPDRKCEHAAQVFDARLPMVLVEMKDDLDIGCGLEPVAAGNERLAQLWTVVDLTVAQQNQ